MSTHFQSKPNLDIEAERAALRSKLGAIRAELRWLNLHFEIKKSAYAWYKSVAPVPIEEVKECAQKLINQPFNNLDKSIDVCVALRWLNKWIAEDEKAQSERAN